MAAPARIAHFVVNLLLPNATLLQFVNHHIYGFVHHQAVEEVGIFQNGFFGWIGLLTGVMFTDNVGNRYIEVLGKFVVTLIATGHAHDGARAVAGQHVLADPHRHVPSVKRINGIGTRKRTGYFFHFGHAVYFRAGFNVFQILIHFGLLRGCGNFFDEIMLGCKHHEVNAKDGVGAGGKDGEDLTPRPPLHRRGGGGECIFYFLDHEWKLLKHLRVREPNYTKSLVF